MADPATLPGWPRYLSRPEAARYLGVSATTFDQEVSAGWWPTARKRGLRDARLTWDRLLLDAYADKAAGPLLQSAGQDRDAVDATAESTAAAEAAALRGIGGIEHAQAANHRAKRRHQKAA